MIKDSNFFFNGVTTDVKTVYLLDWTTASTTWNYPRAALNCVPVMAGKVAVKIG
jgi:hypothetical protein